MSTTTPAELVSNITELLEKICSYIPNENLFKYITVNKKWQAVITQSPLLQRKLFLKAEVVDKIRSYSGVEFNPLLHESWLAQCLPRTCPIADIEQLTAWNIRNAVWRQSHISKPSSKEVRVLTLTWNVTSGVRPLGALKILRNPDGVKMSDLCTSFLRYSPSSADAMAIHITATSYKHFRSECDDFNETRAWLAPDGGETDDEAFEDYGASMIPARRSYFNQDEIWSKGLPTPSPLDYDNEVVPHYHPTDESLLEDGSLSEDECQSEDEQTGMEYEYTGI